jgi:hypothetical protein
VSEYQYYEFLAVDRALDAHQLDEVRAISTRAHITPTSFVNTYHWGNFHGDPRRMVERGGAYSNEPSTGTTTPTKQTPRPRSTPPYAQ